MTTEVRLPVDEQFEGILADLDRGDEDSAAEAVAELSAEDRRRTLFGMMRAAGAIAAEVEAIREYNARVTAECEAAIAPKRRRLAWIEEQCKASAEPLLTGKSKHVDMPGAGRIQFRDYEPSLRVADAEAFIAALGPDERERLVEMIPKLKTVDAKGYAATVLQDHGELIPGIERVPAHREASISYEAAG